MINNPSKQPENPFARLTGEYGTLGRVIANPNPKIVMHGRLLLSLIILTVGANLGLADRATYDPTKTQMALPLPTPPTIDGVIDTAVEWQWAQGVGPSWIVRPDTALDDGIRGGM